MTLGHSGRESSGPSGSRRAEVDDHDSEGGDEGFYYGYHTDKAVSAYGLPDSMFRRLHSVQTNYSMNSWAAGIVVEAGLSKHVAEYIASAMRKDYDLAKAAAQ